MLSMKHVIRSRPSRVTLSLPSSSSSTIVSAAAAAETATEAAALLGRAAKDIVASFKNYFRGRHNPFYDQIYGILASKDTSATAHDSLLTGLNLRLTESLVVEVLSYGRSSSQDVLCCLKFFDWAGRQPGFYHTRATFHAIFRILSRARRRELMLSFQDFRANKYVEQVRFNDTLVMGYAVVGKPDVALQLFGRMRYHGQDLDPYVYHVLLNALVEDGCYEAVQMVARQISDRGFESDITRSILVKSLCRQSKLEEAEGYLRKLAEGGDAIAGEAVRMLVDALCQKKRFKQAGKLLQEFEELNVPMEPAYGIWLRKLVKAGNMDLAIEFLKSKKSLEGYVPEAFQYNALVFRLLKENRLAEVCDLFLDMVENKIYMDEITMNAVLCFFSKAGMTDVALELFKSRSEFGFSPNYLAYNYLINTLCWTGNVDEAYSVLRSSADQGYFPGEMTFSILARALCRKGKLDIMWELLQSAPDWKFLPNDSTDDFIIALCKAGRVDQGYLIHSKISRLENKSSERTFIKYIKLISGFSRLDRGDLAARLLFEMQDRGYEVPPSLFRIVVCSICRMENHRDLFFNFLQMQVSRSGSYSQTCNLFIQGAGVTKKPELAREVFEMMRKSGIEPAVKSEILLLRSYLRSERISDALAFFDNVCQRSGIRKSVCAAVLVGLCRANQADTALKIYRLMKINNIVPGIECYENLIQLLCSHEKYDEVVHLVKDFERTGRCFTSFIGNVLLLHAFKTQNLYKAWVRSSHLKDQTPEFVLLGQLIGIFSGCIQVHNDVVNVQDIVGQCFPLDRYTYNMLLRKLGGIKMDYDDLFKQMCLKGHEPNRWTYDIIVHGLLKEYRIAEARIWLERMSRKGYVPTDGTRELVYCTRRDCSLEWRRSERPALEIVFPV